MYKKIPVVPVNGQCCGCGNYFSGKLDYQDAYSHCNLVVVGKILEFLKGRGLKGEIWKNEEKY